MTRTPSLCLHQLQCCCRSRVGRRELRRCITFGNYHVKPLWNGRVIGGGCVVKLVVLMDPVDETDDVLRQNRSREKQFMFDLALDGQSTQVASHRRRLSSTLSLLSAHTSTRFPSNRHHRSSGDCLEGKRENYQVCSVQYCVQHLYTVNCTYI